MLRQMLGMLKMRKKEEIGYGIIVLFVLTSLFFIALMVPFDTATGAVIFDTSQQEIEEGAKNIFFSAPAVNFAILAIVGTLIVGGSFAIVQQKREAEEFLETLPRMSRLELMWFVEDSLEAGYKKEDIWDTLLEKGWDKKYIDSVLRLY